MRLQDLIEGLPITLADDASGDIRICDITEDSRTVMPGSLFVARKGLSVDGREFITQAIAMGAAGILTDPEAPRPRVLASAAWLTTPDPASVESCLGERFFKEPSSKLRLAGVTGTNGKTTVAHLVYQLMNAAGQRCGQVGTVFVDDGIGIARSAMTTPPALELSLSLANMVEAGYRAAVLEASSHALDQQRVAALDFNVGVFTNLSGDHLDYHGDLESYASAKARLFSMLPPGGVAVVNADDPRAEFMVQECPARILRCSMAGAAGAETTAETVRTTAQGALVRLRGAWGEIQAQTGMIGEFNVMNLLLAVASAHELGIDPGGLEEAIGSLDLPEGRLQRVARAVEDADRDPLVLVDFAHTDDALRHALGAARPIAEARGGRLRVVFGCGGDRDRTKRPRMGRVARSIGDVLYVTSDNPRTESPSDIVRDVLGGITETGDNVHVDVDRRRAIEKAVVGADPRDVVVIAGKGHEQEQILAGEGPATRTVRFVDQEVALEALHNRERAGGEPRLGHPHAAERAGSAEPENQEAAP